MKNDQVFEAGRDLAEILRFLHDGVERSQQLEVHAQGMASGMKVFKDGIDAFNNNPLLIGEIKEMAIRLARELTKDYKRLGSLQSEFPDLEYFIDPNNAFAAELNYRMAVGNLHRAFCHLKQVPPEKDELSFKGF